MGLNIRQIWKLKETCRDKWCSNWALKFTRGISSKLTMAEELICEPEMDLKKKKTFLSRIEHVKWRDFKIFKERLIDVEVERCRR